MITKYSLLFIIFMALSFLIISIIFDIQKNKKLSSFIALFMVITYSVIFGLRDHSIGSDTESYIGNFIYNNWNFEYLFTLLTDAIRLIINNPTLYLVIITTIYGLGIFTYCYLYGKKLNTSIVLFIWCIIFSPSIILGSINYLRQPLAFSIFLIGFALYATAQKHSLYSISLMVGAVLIHSSISILVFIVLFIPFIKIKHMILILGAAIIFFIVGIGDYIITNYGDSYFIQRTLSRHIYFNPRRSITTIYLNIFLYLFHLAIFLFLLHKEHNNSLGKITINFYGLLLSLAIFLSFNRELSLRYYYLLQFLIPIIYMCFIVTSKYKKLIKPFLIFYSIIYLCYLLSRPWFIDQLSGNITL